MKTLTTKQQIEAADFYTLMESLRQEVAEANERFKFIEELEVTL